MGSALTAQEGGSDRIELCSALSEGCLTPSYGTIREVKRRLSIPVHVLIRPREGDFTYTPEEVAVICEDIRTAKDLGADAIVFGALDRHGNIDVVAMKQAIDAASGLPITFHRAFDVCSDPFEAIQRLSDLGIRTLLTSGQKPTAPEGVTLIRKLVEWSMEKGITIMPGCGLNSGNIVEVVLATGAQVAHLSASRDVAKGHNETDMSEVRACRRALDTLD
jgi:copper homeostasis protein